MASIEYDARLEPDIMARYGMWRRAQPRLPNQVGGTIFIDVTGGPDDNGMIFRRFPVAFIDELVASGLAVTRK